MAVSRRFLLDLANNRLGFATQPIRCLRTGRTVMQEVLVRPDGMTPLRMFSLAERLTCIKQLEIIVLRQAFDAAAPLLGVVTINVSAAALDPEVAERFVTEATRCGVRDRVVAEVTGGVAHEDFEEALEVFRTQGVLFCADDLGEDACDVHRVRSMRAPMTKLAASMLRPEHGDTLDEILATLPPDVALVVEGIEDLDLLRLACTMGARYGQGFVLGPPMPC